MRVVGRRCELREVSQSDLQWLYEASLSKRAMHRWRFHGQTIAPHLFEQSLHENVFAQFVVEKLGDTDPAALMVAYDADHVNHHVSVAALLTEEAERSAWPVEGFFLLIQYLFEWCDMHKVYVEAVEYNLPHFGRGLERVFVREACLSKDVYYDGRRWDFYVFGVLRCEWVAHAPRLLPTVSYG